MEVKRIPSTSLSQSQLMQFANENTISKFPQVAFVFSRGGTPDLAADPMPPSATDTYIILKPRAAWPDPTLTKDDLIQAISEKASKLPGNKFDFSQPIQMRFNELIAGVKEDLAVKVFGDEFEPMRRAANQIAGILNGIPGAAGVKVEDVTGMPVLEIKIDNTEIARRGLSLSTVQDAIGIAIGGKATGVVFEGDRRFQIVVRLSDVQRNDIETLKRLPIALPEVSPNANAATIPLQQIATFQFSEGPNQVSRDNGKRRVVVTANVRGRDMGSLVDEAQAKIAEQVKLPPGYWLVWGGQFENFVAAQHRLFIVVPICFVLIFLLLLGSLGSARDALLVYSAVPLALTGGVVALWLRGMTFSISSAVGFIALSGVAVLNGLVMLTFIRQLQREGAEGRGHHPRRAHASAPGRHDRARRLVGIRADGDRNRDRRRSSETARDGRHRRFDQFNVVDALGSASAVRVLFRRRTRFAQRNRPKFLNGNCWQYRSSRRMRREVYFDVGPRRAEDLPPPRGLRCFSCSNSETARAKVTWSKIAPLRADT